MRKFLAPFLIPPLLALALRFLLLLTPLTECTGFDCAGFGMLLAAVCLGAVPLAFGVAGASRYPGDRAWSGIAWFVLAFASSAVALFAIGPLLMP